MKNRTPVSTGGEASKRRYAQTPTVKRTSGWRGLSASAATVASSTETGRRPGDIEVAHIAANSRRVLRAPLTSR